MKTSSRTALYASAAAFLAALSLLLSAREYPHLFRRASPMEKAFPICVLGVSEPTGVISGRTVAIRNIFINWKTSYPASAVRSIKHSGAVPMITWEPYDSDIKNDALLSDIADGKYDSAIARFARASRGSELFIRFAHEPNGDWYGWSGIRSGTELYIRAFRHVRGIFREAGSGALFVFSVNSEDVPDDPGNRFETYYPGDDHVDVVGIDAYNWGDGEEPWHKWKSPADILTPVYERVVRAFPEKPVFLTETASAEGPRKARWIRALLSEVDTRFKAVKAIIWFDFRKERDWTLSNRDSREAFYGSCGKGRITCARSDLHRLLEGPE